MDLRAIRWCYNRQLHAKTAKHCTLRYLRIDENVSHILNTLKSRVPDFLNSSWPNQLDSQILGHTNHPFIVEGNKLSRFI